MMALMSLSESIEMVLFSSREKPTLQREEEHAFCQDFPSKKAELHWQPETLMRHREHPLVPDLEEDSEEEEKFQAQPRRRVKPEPEPPATAVTVHCSPLEHIREEIEMKVFPPLSASQNELTEHWTNKAGRLLWKKRTPQSTGLVVKDVICLPKLPGVAQLERYVAPQLKETAAPGMKTRTSTRMTLDCSWSASQVLSRLDVLFRGTFVKEEGQKLSFIYLQCLQGSKVLFVPDPPAEGWTGEQIVRISGHGPLYVFAHLDLQQDDMPLAFTCGYRRVVERLAAHN